MIVKEVARSRAQNSFMSLADAHFLERRIIFQTGRGRAAAMQIDLHNWKKIRILVWLL